MAYFKFKNKRIHYRMQGEGHPLILLHGNTASSKMFDSIIDLYTDQFRVITIDFLGHGQSDRLKQFPVRLWSDEAQQVIALIEYLELKKSNLLGTSGGAWVALNIALKRPDLIGRVIADSFDGRTLGEDFLEQLIRERAACKNSEDAKRFFKNCHGEDWESIVDQDTDSLLKMAESADSLFDMEIAQLECPLLLTASKKDDMIRKDISREYGSILKLVADGEMHLFQKGFHPAVISNASEFSKCVKEFCRKKTAH